jgi:hypothetical protein
VKLTPLLAASLSIVALTGLVGPDLALAMGSNQSRREAVPGVQRAAHGKIKRNPAARASFQRSHPCLATGRSSGACPGYVIDHVVPLKRGGADRPSNMQWQTKEAGK